MNFIIILLVIELTITFALHIYHESKSNKNEKEIIKNDNLIERKYGARDYSQIYPDYSVDKINELHNETYKRNFYYDPYLQFREKPFAGKHLNVSKHGYRKSPFNENWPPTKEHFNIMIFGGSTAFGYGVDDKDTIGAKLNYFVNQEYGDRAVVYNFGCAWYYSTQERILLENIILNEIDIDLALFIDGLNDVQMFTNEPALTNNMLQLFNHANIESVFPYNTGIMRVIRKIGGTSKYNHIQYIQPDQDFDPEKIAQRLIKNHTLISSVCDSNNIETYFFIQPIPDYMYDDQYHYYPSSKEYKNKRSRFYKVLKNKIIGVNYLNYHWLADMQKDIKIPLYIDNVHYSPHMSEKIAGKIFNTISEKITFINEP